MENYYEAIDLLKGMISRPSLSQDEKDVADYLQKTWEENGHILKRSGNNIWLTAPDFDPSKPTILLNSHIDTVKPVAGWSKDPFQPIEDEEEKLYGLGSNDAGASIVSLYAAFKVLSTRPQPYNLIFLASCEEEISGKNGIESVIPLLPPISFAIVGEPTAMEPAVAEKGLMVLDCIATGKSGHAARNEGINAISLAIKDIEWFHSYTFPQKSDFLGPVKMSVTLINAGTQHNVIPDTCSFTVDIRTNECYSNEEVYNIICEQVDCEVKARSFRLNSSRTPIQHPFVERACLLGKKPFGSPTLSDQALMPFLSIKMGPGNSARSHSADEFIYLMEIREAIQTYIILLDGLELNPHQSSQG